ncbi:MAG: glycosyltransferase [Bacteroidales bacterium]|nr:glycosyltransferase [Bacteroidales bacterium]
MKIIIAGNFSNKASIEEYYFKYLSKLTSVYTIDIASDFNTELKNNFFKKILRRFDIKYVYKRFNKKIFLDVETTDADILIVFKGINILPSTLRKIKDKGIVLVNYNPDHPFSFAGRGSGNKNIKKSFNLYDLHISYSPVIIDLIKSRYNIQTAHLPFGFELPDAIYEETKKYEEINKVCFIGNPDKKRICLINYLLNREIKIDVFGNGWKNRTKHNNLNAYDPVYNKEFWINTGRYRVQLNVFREHNEGSHNMRTFEVPGAGGILLTPFSEEQAQYFKEDEEIIFFKNEEECSNKIKDILNRDKTGVLLFREKARNRSIDSKYSYKNRADELYKILDSNFSSTLKRNK